MRKTYSMLLSLTKPIGRFIEYTLKPLLDDTREVIELAEKNGWNPQEIKRSILIYSIWQTVLNLVQTIIVTGAICYTCLRIMK